MPRRRLTPLGEPWPGARLGVTWQRAVLRARAHAALTLALPQLAPEVGAVASLRALPALRVQVGSGAFGKAYRVARKLDGREFVIKSINTSSVSKKERVEAHREVQVMKVLSDKCSHPNIVQYFHSFVAPRGPVAPGRGTHACHIYTRLPYIRLARALGPGTRGSGRGRREEARGDGDGDGDGARPLGFGGARRCPPCHGARARARCGAALGLRGVLRPRLDSQVQDKKLHIVMEYADGGKSHGSK